jgi:hypothetical protein
MNNKTVNQNCVWAMFIVQCATRFGHRQAHIRTREKNAYLQLFIVTLIEISTLTMFANFEISFGLVIMCCRKVSFLAYFYLCQVTAYN